MLPAYRNVYFSSNIIILYDLAFLTNKNGFSEC